MVIVGRAKNTMHANGILSRRDVRGVLKISSPRTFAHTLCISPTPQSPLPKLETTRGLSYMYSLLIYIDFKNAID